MADGNIKLYGKLKSVTEEGKVADYSEIDGVPIIMHDLSASEFTPTANTYYLHTGETTVAYDNGTIYFYNGTNYTSITGGGLFNDFGLTQGDQKYSIVQKRIKSDGSTVTAKAYQRGTAAFGGGTVAGDSNGVATDYSFAFAANENNKAIARSSAAFGRYNTSHNIGEFVCGDYASNNRNPNTVFAVGTGYSDDRRETGFEVRKDGTFVKGEVVASKEWVQNNAVKREGTSYVLYGNQEREHQVVIPYRFNKQDIVGAALPLMFQPMMDGRFYTRYPTDEYHAANKGYVDSKTRLYRHEITTTDLQRTLVVINNSSTKITKFTDLLNGNYISMSLKIDESGKHVVTPAVAVSVYNGNSSTITGIQVRYYYDITNMSFGTYLDSKLSSDTVTEL